MHLQIVISRLLDTIDDLVDELEDVTVTDTSNEVQVRIFRIKRALAHMRRTLSPQVEVANATRGTHRQTDSSRS